MTQIVPTTAMVSMISVKASDISVQPPSARGFMCRKKIMCTTIWITAQASTAKAVACTEAKPPDMTSPKGITVRMTDSTKPVT